MGKATAILFIKGRLRFYHVSGKQGGTAGAPSVLIAYGSDAAKRLQNSKESFFGLIRSKLKTLLLCIFAS